MNYLFLIIPMTYALYYNIIYNFMLLYNWELEKKAI